jgi:cellulose synthase operon protein C
LPGVHYELAEAILESSPNDTQVQAEAEKELETAVSWDGDSAKTECLFARIADRRGEADKASVHYQRAFALNPGVVEAQMGLGRILASREKPQEAMKYFRMAVQADPLDGEAHYRLASVYRVLQMKDEAKKEVQLYLEIKKAKDRLEELYRQMNRKPPEHGEEHPDAEP